MTLTTNSLPTTLIWLLEQKTKRDGVPFTSSQLANALNVPRSLIQRLIHPDPSKRVINPRVDTLLKVVNFFKKDGFEISINDFLVPQPHCRMSQAINTNSQIVSIPIYSFTNLCETLGNFSLTSSLNASRSLTLVLQRMTDSV